MNEIEKFLRKISEKERLKIKKLMTDIIRSDDRLKIVKIKNTDFYRVRQGKFRIIFHKEGRIVVIDNVQFRNDNTYKNL